MQTLKHFIGAALLAVGAQAAAATPGDLDPTFAFGGYNAVGYGDYTASDDLVVDRAGFVYTAGTDTTGGTTTPILAKYKPDGSLDTSFGVGGFATPATVPANVMSYAALVMFRDYLFQLVSADDKLYVYAFDTNGVPQAWFGTGGVSVVTVGLGIYPVLDIAQWGNNLGIAASARNPATGNVDFVVAQMSLSGALIPGFGTGGVAYSRVWSGAGARNRLTGLAFQPDGRIVAAGRAAKPGGTYDFVVARYRTDGTPDPTFALGGFRVIGFGDNDYGRRVALKKDGRIVTTGSACKTIDPSTGEEYCLLGAAQLKADGSLDAGFGSGGQITWDLGRNGVTVTDFVLDPRERPVVVGQHHVDTDQSTAFVARLKTNGALDAGYGGGGWVDVTYGYDANANGGVKVYPSTGQIVTAGTTIKIVDPTTSYALTTVARHEN